MRKARAQAQEGPAFRSGSPCGWHVLSTLSGGGRRSARRGPRPSRHAAAARQGRVLRVPAGPVAARMPPGPPWQSLKPDKSCAPWPGPILRCRHKARCPLVGGAGGL